MIHHNTWNSKISDPVHYQRSISSFSLHCVRILGHLHRAFLHHTSGIRDSNWSFTSQLSQRCRQITKSVEHKLVSVYFNWFKIQKLGNVEESEYSLLSGEERRKARVTKCSSGAGFHMMVSTNSTLAELLRALVMGDLKPFANAHLTAIPHREYAHDHLMALG
ncbi:hypothetical protein ADUPG1_008551 [Aduncisulcus paluster]|uniref:Uncharacterized protein n=1 Tax=Aduncisulcus paluster TaxID=2918883 RepID=A0ABQ5KVA3_9EUKA|nr:hypothetical protein ADUPG1_008551 [Aduncisulcus paluster]